MTKISQFKNDRGVAVRNQFMLETDQGNFFQSYNSIIAFKPYNANEKIKLDPTYWRYSKTTSKYRSQFLNETTDETQKKINDGVYVLEDLNR